MEISILVAARNEENNIIDCLASLNNLKYPNSDYEVLIGNDGSSDNTALLVKNFIEGKSQFYLYNIDNNIGLAKGKANVLAQLASKAKGKYLLITDADIEVNPNWISGMTNGLNTETGIVTGFTTIRGNAIFAKLQAIDWISGLVMIKFLSDLKIPITSMGNNMLVSKKAYLSTGGYETIPFSVTEDYALFKAIVKNKWDFKNIINKEVMAYSKPIQSFTDLLHQRKRWMHGGMQLPFYIKSILGIQSLFLPLILMLFTFNPMIASTIWSAKFLFHSISITSHLVRIQKTGLLLFMPIYEIYVNILSFVAVIFYFLPIKLMWKGRAY